MAVLTNSDFNEIKNHIKASGNYDTFAAWGLDKATWKNVFQTCEDYFVNAFAARPATAYKPAIEAVAGAMTNGQAKAIFDVWVTWKLRHL